jgi:cell division protein FtsN
MARDYKYRASQNRKKSQKTSVAWWKWIVIIILISLFVFFLIFLSNSTPKTKSEQQTKSISTSKQTKKTKSPPKHQNKKQKEPRFDFYTILPETEIIVPDYEINTRSREEQFGKAKTSKYIIQAGSFRDFSEADKLRARLALMGIESRVEKAKVGKATWNRVKIGPYSRSSSVSSIKKRLKRNGIDVIVTEIKS